MKKNYFLFISVFMLQCFLGYAQTVQSYSTASGALTTYKFSYVTSNLIGKGTNNTNVFMIQSPPTGYPNFVAYNPISAFAPNAVLKINGEVVDISANFGMYGSWTTGIQLSTNTLAISAGSSIELTISNIISNPTDPSGSYTFNWKIADAQGNAIQSFSVPVTFSNLSTIDLGEKSRLSLLSNPVKDFAVVNGLSKGDLVSLYDMSGKLVQATQSSGVSCTINTSSFKNGVYLLKVGSRTIKMMVSK